MKIVAARVKVHVYNETSLNQPALGPKKLAGF
jgi:hypothetical protein